MSRPNKNSVSQTQKLVSWCSMSFPKTWKLNCNYRLHMTHSNMKIFSFGFEKFEWSGRKCPYLPSILYKEQPPLRLEPRWVSCDLSKHDYEKIGTKLISCSHPFVLRYPCLCACSGHGRLARAYHLSCAATCRTFWVSDDSCDWYSGQRAPGQCIFFCNYISCLFLKFSLILLILCSSASWLL